MKRRLQSPVFKRILWTIFILFIYVLGTQMTLPFVDVNSPRFLNGTIASLAYSTALMGGNLRSLSLFSVGLSPWMSSMLLWQMFAFSKHLGMNRLSPDQQSRYQMYLTVVIALIQSLAISLYLPLQAGVNPFLTLTMNTFLLIAGSFFLIWLSDINALFGVGGPTVIIMTSMTISMPQTILTSIVTLKIPTWLVSILIVLGIISLYVSVVVMASKYRLPVNKIGLNNRFKRYSYYDIPLTPAVGMPFMYAMTFVSLPQYFLMLFQLIFPKNGWTTPIIQALVMGTPIWLFLYLLILFLLALAFAFVNVSGERVSEQMKKSGEYIYGIYPGKDTSQYINRLVTRFAVIGAIYTLTIAGLPMLVVLYDPRYLQLSMIPGLFMIFSGMMYNIKEEVKALRMNENYRSLF